VELLLRQSYSGETFQKDMIKNLAPEIFRQRLLIEGVYTSEIGKESLEKYLLDIAEYLSLRI